MRLQQCCSDLQWRGWQERPQCRHGGAACRRAASCNASTTGPTAVTARANDASAPEQIIPAVFPTALPTNSHRSPVTVTATLSHGPVTHAEQNLPPLGAPEPSSDCVGGCRPLRRATVAPVVDCPNLLAAGLFKLAPTLRDICVYALRCRR
jgi:hypothetical protein